MADIYRLVRQRLEFKRNTQTTTAGWDSWTLRENELMQLVAFIRNTTIKEINEILKNKERQANRTR